MAINVFEMFAKLNMDSSDFESGLDKASSTAKTFLKGIGISIGAVSTGIAVLTKKAVDSYADYQQNLGGVQKLYGNMGQSLEEYANSVGKSTDEVKGQWEKLESAQSTVLKNAQNAYKTAGMSANQYMETATQFSASLISSLGGDTQKSAEMTDVAMRAISDNWNTFGGDLESITNAYKGFSKQNFTMLDNLKLGYGGTKEEMQRLIDHANKLGEAYGVTSKLSIDSFADIVTAIQAVQQEQNIAGTTAREASTTVSGSINMAKMAWENLVTGFGDGTANLDALIGNLVDSIIGYTDEAGEHVNGVVDNLMPVIQSALTGIATAIQGLIPIISEQLPTMISTLLPIVLESATNLVTGLISSLPAILQVLINSLPVIISTLITGVDWSGVFNSLSETLQSVITVFQNLGKQVFDWFTGDGLSQLIQCGTQWIVGLSQGLVEGIPNLLEQALPMILQFAESLRANFGLIVDAGIQVLQNLVQGIANGLPTMIQYLPTIISEFCGLINDNLPKILEAGFNMLVTLAQGIVNAIPTLLTHIPEIFSAIIDVWTALNWIDMGKNVIKWITDGIKSLFNNIPNLLKNIGDTAKGWFKNIDWASLGNSLISKITGALRQTGANVWNTLKGIGQSAMNIFKNMDWSSLGTNLVRGIWNGISNVTGWIINKIGGFTSSVLKSIKGFFGIHSPSKKTAWVGKMLMEGMSKGIDDNVSEVISSMSDMGKEVMKEADSMSIKTSVKAIGESVTDSNKSEDSSKYKTSGGIVINVYASEEMDIDELVEEIMIKLEKARKKEEEVFA